MALKILVPKKFVCYYSLELGATFVAICMGCITLLVGVSILIQGMSMVNSSCEKYVLRSAFGFSVTAIIYNAIMFIVNVSLLWATRKGRATIVLIWIVITSVWLVQIFFLLIVLLCMYQLEVGKTAGVLSLVLGLLSIAIFAYFIMVVFGYWLELKNKTNLRLTKI